MSFFDDDPMDSIFREFFGDAKVRRRYNKSSESEEEERVIDFIENGKYVYLVIELPGYEQDDVQVQVSGNSVEVTARKRVMDEMKEYLAQKLAQGMRYKKLLPEGVSTKHYDLTMKNGVLELKFPRK